MTATVEITAAEAAARLGVTKRQILRYIALGKLPARRVEDGPYPNGYFVISTADLTKVKPGRAPNDPLVTDEFLRKIAVMYRQAVAREESPRQHISEEYGRTKRTVDRWIAAARERNLLGDWGSEKRR